jgi:hypothetical protein
MFKIVLALPDARAEPNDDPKARISAECSHEATVRPSPMDPRPLLEDGLTMREAAQQ